MLKGVHLTLMIGPGVPVPVPQSVLDALVNVRVMSSTAGASGFELTFTLSNRSPLHTLFLIGGSAPIPLVRVVIAVTVNGITDVLMDGGFPLKRACTAVPLQSLRRMPTSTVGLSQANVPSTMTRFVALLEHLPALTTTLMSMGLVPIGLMTTDSPAAVDGVPFAIVHFAVAGGARSTRAVKEDSMFVAAGATIVASRIVQSTR